MKLVKAILLIFLITTSLFPMKKPVTGNLQSKLGQVKLSLAELRGKLGGLKAKLEALKALMNQKEEPGKEADKEPITEKNIWDKLKELVQKQNGKDFNLTPEIIDEWNHFDTQINKLKTDLTKIKDDVVLDEKYFAGIDLARYARGAQAAWNRKIDRNKSNERAVMLFKHLRKKIWPIMRDKSEESYISIGKRIEQIASHNLDINTFLAKQQQTTMRPIYQIKYDQLNDLSRLIDEIKLGIFNRLQEVFFYLYKGYAYKQDGLGHLLLNIIIEDYIPDKKTLIEKFALKFNDSFKTIDNLFINSFRVDNYKFAGQQNIDDADLGGIRSVAISDLADCYNSDKEKNGFDNVTTRKAFHKLVWFLLANMFKPNSNSLLIKTWNRNQPNLDKIKFGGFSAIINLPVEFWDAWTFQGSGEISDEEATHLFTTLGMPGTTLDNLKQFLYVDSDDSAIDSLNAQTNLEAEYIKNLKGNTSLSFKDKIKNMLSHYKNSKYHMDEIKKDFWQDDNLANLRQDAKIDEEALLSTGQHYDDDVIKNYLHNGKIQFLLMRRFLRELNSQHLFNMFNTPPTSQEIKEIIIEGIKKDVIFFPQKIQDAIETQTLSEKFIRDLFAEKQRELHTHVHDANVQKEVLQLKAIVWTFNFINENSGNEKDEVNNRTGFVKFVTGQTRPEFIKIGVFFGQVPENLEAHSCPRELYIPRHLLNDYETFKVALLGVVK